MIAFVENALFGNEKFIYKCREQGLKRWQQPDNIVQSKKKYNVADQSSSDVSDDEGGGVVVVTTKEATYLKEKMDKMKKSARVEKKKSKKLT